MANFKWFPIYPLRKKDDSFYALSLMDNAEDLKPLDLEENDNPFSQFKVMQSTLNIHTAADLGVAVCSLTR